MRLLDRFKADTNGTTAALFGLALVPVMGLAGLAVDYGRAVSLRSEVQRAADATALALVAEARRSTTAQLADGGRLVARGRQVFAAMLPPREGVTVEPATVTREGGLIRVEGRAEMRSTLSSLLGLASVPVQAEAESMFGRIELALVLDTTGSMAEAGKMTELKRAVSGRGGLLDILKASVRQPGDVRVSVVPFNTQVQVGTAYRDAPWLRWDVTLENATLRQAGLAAPPQRQAWTGCVSDRDQRYDATSEAPTLSRATQHVAARCHYGTLAPLRPLTDDLESVRSAVDAMQPTGATNVTIGYSFGLATLRADSPFGGTSADDAAVSKVMIVLTDGENTQNRWTGNGSGASTQIDARLRTACDEARSDARTRGIQVFTIKVIEGNAGLLRACASDPSMFKEVTAASQLKPVFEEIAQAILRTRLTH